MFQNLQWNDTIIFVHFVSFQNIAQNISTIKHDAVNKFVVQIHYIKINYAQFLYKFFTKKIHDYIIHNSIHIFSMYV